MKLIIAEKPSVARDLAQTLGVPIQGRSHFRGKDYIITWAVGHLVTLAEPHIIDPSWKKWRESDLPILPHHWPLAVLENTAAQFEEIKSLMHRPEVTSIIAATDAGREGELIFRYIYEKAECRKPVERLWLSSLTPESIKLAMSQLKPLSAYDRLADNARGRSRSDWLVGLNFSRAYSLRQNDKWTVGRVQTPTLAMVVERTEAILNFVPESYREIEAQFQTLGTGEKFKALFVDPKAKKSASEEAAKSSAKRFAPDDPEIARIKARGARGQAAVKSREDREQKVPPPRLYDLTELQKDANRLFGFQAKQTLDLAQSLYESHKLITYPRSDSRYLSSAVAQNLPRVVAAIRGPYESVGLHPDTGAKPLSKMFVDDSKVSDHHAIIPTGKTPESARLGADESKIFDLIAKRLLMAWQEDQIKSQSRILAVITTEDDDKVYEDHYRASGSIVLREGWRKLERRSNQPAEPLALPLVAPGEGLKALKVEELKKETKPPPAFSDATLLNGMASAGSRLDERELSDILRERGLGTPATRAAIIETLIQRHYVERKEKTLVATELGRNLIHHVHPSVRSAALTGEWEAKLKRIEAGDYQFDAFMREIEDYVRETIAMIKASPASPTRPAARAERTEPMRKGASGAEPPRQDAAHPEPARQGASVHPTPSRPSIETQPTGHDTSRAGLRAALLKAFGHKNFRQHQDVICKEIVDGHDLLLVMPTGAGKSLCYQLPAVVLPGCTLVISPLIALMDDQVHKLNVQGIPAAALHSGLSRETSREIARSYQDGHLKLLYVAPERLGLPGFLEFLARTPPALVAIDEAHCISQWGHDFRPDYRMLAQRLLKFRPAPVVAMTATATPLVQKDIVEQLALREPKLHIHGFRRTNIAIEVSEVPLPDRPALAKKILARESARPAIIYAPTRKDTETLAEALSSIGKISPYHAGLSHERRQQIQKEFQAGRLDVIVATIAFGMGIDKSDIRTVIHTALPSSVEAYYQEIGRAGRDGKFSRAILLHSYADHRTREFFIKKNYPDIKVLETVLNKVPNTGILRPAIRSNMEAAALDNALEKLWIHGAIEIQSDDEVRATGAAWQKSYLNQQIHKEAEVSLMSNFAQDTQHCRMLLFLDHFGDKEDREPCGICDFCLPLGTLSKTYRPPQTREIQLMRAIMAHLESKDRPTSITKIFQQMEEAGTAYDRKAFDACVDALVRGGIILSRHDSFEKEGQSIHYRTIALGPLAKEPSWDEMLLLEPAVNEPRRAGARKAGPARSRIDSTKSRAGARLRELPKRRQATTSMIRWHKNSGAGVCGWRRKSVCPRIASSRIEP